MWIKAGSIVLGLTLSSSIFGQARWVHARSENFEMYSTGTDAASRDALRAMEHGRAFLWQTLGLNLSGQAPVRIVTSKPDKELGQASVVRGTIAMANLDDAIAPASAAYLHIELDRAGVALPAWLDRGVTDFYSTIKQKNGQLTAGDVNTNQRRALLSQPWESLASLLTAPDSKNRAAINYTSALVHMLMLSPDYKFRFKELVAELQPGGSSQAAMEKVYGKPLAALEKDLLVYIRSEHFAAAPIGLNADNLAAPTVEPAGLFDLQMAQAGVQTNATQAQSAYETLAAQNPARPEPWEALGHLAILSGRKEAAEEDFGKAAELSREHEAVAVGAKITLGTATAAVSTAREKAIEEAKALEEAENLTRAAAEARQKVMALSRDRAAAEAQEKVAARQKEKAAADAAATEAALKAQADAREKADAKVRERAELDATKQKEKAAAAEAAATEAALKAQAEAREKAEARVREKEERIAREKALAEAHERVLAEARERAQADAREKADAKAREKSELEARDRAFAEAREKLASEKKAADKAEADAKLKAEADAKAQAAARQAAVVPAPQPKPEPPAPAVVAANVAPAAPVVAAPAPAPVEQGSFVDLVCSGGQIKLVVQTAEGRKNFLIDNPANVLISGREGGKVDLSCGPQKPTSVRVQYAHSPGPTFDGLVRAIYFD